MKLGMMQPYFFPYLGYWQLMNMVDEYIVYDDVNYIKNGWIHRNRIKINGQSAYFNITMKKASQNKIIRDIELNMDDTKREKLLAKLQYSYARAPYFKETMELFQSIIYSDQTYLGGFLVDLNRKVAEYLGITTKIYSCTELGFKREKTGVDRIYDICRMRGCDKYINAIGGKALYNKEDFLANGIELEFLRMDPDITYPQGKGDYIQGLSIIDVLMYNSLDEVKALLERYSLE